MVYIISSAIMAVIILTSAFIRRKSKKADANPAANNLQETVVSYASQASVLDQKAIIVLLFESTHPGFVAHDSEFFEFYQCCKSFFEELYPEKSDKHDNRETDTESGDVQTDDLKEAAIKAEEKVVPVIKDLFIKRRQILLGELNSSKGALKKFKKDIVDFINLVKNLSELSPKVDLVVKSDIGQVFMSNLSEASEKLGYSNKLNENDIDAKEVMKSLEKISEAEKNIEKDYSAMIVVRWYSLCRSFRSGNTEETHLSKTYHQVVERKNAILSRCTDYNRMLTSVDKYGVRIDI